MGKNIVIDRKSQQVSFAFGVEKVDTTLTLVQMETGKFGIGYDAKYSGVKSGHVSGGPFEVSGNMEKVVHDKPKIVFQLSEWSESATHISMKAKITVDYLGNYTLFDKALAGAVPAADYLQEMLDSFTKGIKTGSEASPA